MTPAAPQIEFKAVALLAVYSHPAAVKPLRKATGVDCGKAPGCPQPSVRRRTAEARSHYQPAFSAT